MSRKAREQVRWTCEKSERRELERAAYLRQRTKNLTRHNARAIITLKKQYLGANLSFLTPLGALLMVRPPSTRREGCYCAL
jgi:hypothetical protein